MNEVAKVMDITKPIADEWLQNNTINRKIRRSHVEFIKRQLIGGFWQYNGETIIISKTGKLLDGQHRLMGVSETGIPIRSLVCFGVDDSAFKNIGGSIIRTSADKTKKPQHLCEIINAYDAYVLNNTRRKLSADELINLYESKQREFDWASEMKPKARVIGRAPVWAGLVLYAENDFENADIFAKDFKNDCGIIPQASILKAWLYRTEGSGGMTSQETFKKTLYCAHCHMKGISISRVGVMDVKRAFK